MNINININIDKNNILCAHKLLTRFKKLDFLNIVKRYILNKRPIINMLLALTITQNS